MCPMCISTVVLIAGSVISTGGLAAIAIKKFGGKNAARPASGGSATCSTPLASRRFCPRTPLKPEVPGQASLPPQPGRFNL